MFEFQEYEKAKEVFEKLVKIIGEKKYLEKLAQIYEELHLKDQAIHIYERLGQIDKVTKLKDQKRTDEINDVVIRKFLDLFSGREDVFAVQTDEGYYPVRLPIKKEDALEHLNGEKTLGIYVLSSNNNIKFAVFDVDFKKNFGDYHNALNLCKKVAMNICERLKAEGIKYYVEFSGNRGYHIWIFFDRWLQAYKIRFILKKIVEGISTDDQVSIEIFPKQSDTGGGLGNLIKLPLGIHKKTKNRCPFVDENFEPIQNQLDYLLKIEPNDSDMIEKLYEEFSKEHSSNIQPSEQKIEKPSKVKPSSQVKKLIRREIEPTAKLNLFNAMVQACYPLKQIYEKIDKLGYITEDEEYIMVAACAAAGNSKEFLSDLFKKTINYSQSKLHALINRVGTVPITCEEIKRTILNKSLALSIDQCNCKFSEGLNTPLCLVTNCYFSVLPNIDLRDIVKKIMDKTKEKAELENQIRTLKNLLSQKMTADEINVENVVIRKKNGEVQIII